MLNINCDNATGFRLDTLVTCKQYATPVVQGNEILTTRTDYVSKYYRLPLIISQVPLLLVKYVLEL